MLEAHEPDFNPTYMYIVECVFSAGVSCYSCYNWQQRI